jgi:hypothetical protein
MRAPADACRLNCGKEHDGFVKASSSNPLISLNNLQQLPGGLENECLSLQRTDIINSSFAPKFARAAAETDLCYSRR